MQAVTDTKRPMRRRAPRRAGADGNPQLQAILDTAVEGIIVIDQRGTIKTFNRAAAKMFGYELADVLGRNVKLLMPEPFSGEHDRYITRYLKTGRAKIIGIGREAVGLRRDGTTFPVDLAISEFKHEGQRNFTGIVRDISNRKRLEKEILDVSEREQRRIKLDLHDGLCQELAGIALLAKTMHHRIQAGEKVTGGMAAEVVVLLQNAVKHARALSRGLQPVDAVPNGLLTALRHLAADTADIFSIRCHFHCSRPVEVLDSEAATHVYRIAQECVRYAIQYGRARTIDIDLKHTRGGIELSVSHDAAKSLPLDIFRGDMVREMIHHRARVIGGRIVVRARKGGGVRVTCQIPGIKAA